MAPKTAQQQPQLRQPKNSLKAFLKTDRAILMLCISIAFVFWLFTKLSYQYQSTLEVEVDFGLASDRVLTNPAPDKVEMEVEGTGWDLLNMYFRRKKYLIDINMSDNLPKLLTGSMMKGKIEKQLPDGLRILDIRPDNISLVPEAIATKEIPIVLDSHIELADQYEFKKAVYLTPKSVRVTGPASIISELKEWYTVPLIRQNVVADFKIELDLKNHPNRNVHFSPNKVTCEAKVEQVTEKRFQIEIEKRSVPDSLLLVLLPYRVEVICVVGLSNYDAISLDQINAVADFSKINLMEQKEVKIELENVPDFVQQATCFPKKVDFIVKSQQQLPKNNNGTK